MTKEQIFDEQIGPLVDQIADICEEHRIAALMNFHTPTEEMPELQVMTAFLGREYCEVGSGEALGRMRFAFDVLTQGTDWIE